MAVADQLVASHPTNDGREDASRLRKLHEVWLPSSATRTAIGPAMMHHGER